MNLRQLLLFVVFGVVLVASSSSVNATYPGRFVDIYDQDFISDNGALVKRIAGEYTAMPTKYWRHVVHYVPQFSQNGQYTEVFAFDMHQYNYVDEQTGDFRSIEMTYTYNAQGLPAVRVDVLNVQPLLATRRIVPGIGRQQGVSEYDVKWVGPPSFSNYLVANSKFTQVGLTNNTITYSFTDKLDPSRIYATFTIDARIAHIRADYSGMIYYPNQPTVWVAFDSDVAEISPLHQTVINKVLDGTIELQDDPMALDAGFPSYPVRMHTITGARDVIGVFNEQLYHRYSNATSNFYKVAHPYKK